MLSLRGAGVSEDGTDSKEASSAAKDTTTRSERAQEMFEALWDTKEKHGDGLSLEALQEILETLRDYPEFMHMQETPDVSTIRERALSAQDRMQRVAVFGHSLERNGANIFVLILLKHCVKEDKHEFELYTPSDGPMRADFEKIGVTVNVMSPSEPEYMPRLEQELHRFGAVFANTIMRAEVVRTAQRMGLPYTWVVHEAWPREQFDWYASKVFMQEGIDGSIIKEAFASAEPDTGSIIFPAKMQKRLYDGLVNDEACRVVYNGIPVEKLDDFIANQNRTAIREELGYSEDDFVVLHLGTVCARKCQHVTAEAFASLVNDKEVHNAQLLIVGARYIRPHEIEYIDKVKSTLAKGNVMERATILDIHAEVLKFYMAADVVLVPSKNEVLPLVIAEAQAFQKPVIASNIDGLPEAIDDGQEGLLVPPEDAVALRDAIYKVYADEDLRVRMGALGRVRALHQFSHAKMAEHYGNIMAAMAPPPESLSLAPDDA